MANILSFKTDQEIAHLIAKWVAQQRLKLNVTQQAIASRADIAMSTYKRFEHSGEISLPRFIAVLRAMGRLDLIDLLIESDKGPGPMERLTGKQVPKRKRARSKKR